jgi:formylglycine-generating enzyme
MYSRSIILGLALVVAMVGAAQAQVSPGDMNCDGVVDGLDIAPFIDCLLTGNCPPCPTSSCCHPDGTCTVTTQATCTGTWHAEWTNCNAAQCPQPTGSCCQPNGTCTETLEADCTGYWIIFGTCDPDPCPPVVIETVTIGNPGNAADTRYVTPGYGAVDYVYNIGKYEVTAGQYCEFLNAVAATDTYSLYHPAMWLNSYGCKIERSGTSGNYTYSVAEDWANRPVNYVSWGDAARFANWLHNGQPTGAQDLTTTEDGAYYLNGAMSSAALMAVTRKCGWQWAITSEDEWYKAAYHQNDGVTGNYWDYPTGTNNVPTSEAPPGTDMTNGSANYSSAIGAPYYRTEVGAYNAKPSDSPYGTFDQGGNVWEWNEAAVSGSYRGLRGGAFVGGGYGLRASDRNYYDPTLEFNNDVGFRVSGVH